MSISVLLPCRNSAATIGTQLEALARQETAEPWELVVADNGSTDDTLAVVEGYRQRLPRVAVVDAAGPTRVGYVRNRAVDGAAGGLLLFCDADDEVAPGWLAAMSEALGKHAFVAARPDYAKLNPPWIYQSWEPLPEGGLRTHRFPPYLKYSGGGCLGVRRTVHEEVGGFDESFSSCEDDDYCIRVQLAGHGLAYVPEAVVHIRLRTRARGLFGQARWYAQGEAQLQRKFRNAGPPPNRRKWPIAHWGAIARALLRVGRRSGRMRLVWLLGFQLGRYQGSLRHRVLAI